MSLSISPIYGPVQAFVQMMSQNALFCLSLAVSPRELVRKVPANSIAKHLNTAGAGGSFAGDRRRICNRLRLRRLVLPKCVQSCGAERSGRNPRALLASPCALLAAEAKRSRCAGLQGCGGGLLNTGVLDERHGLVLRRLAAGYRRPCGLLGALASPY